MSLGYVIVTFNQASGRPKLSYGGDIYDSDIDALEDANGLLAENRENGRREGFVVARLEWEHDAEVSNPANVLPGNTPYVPAEHRYPEGDEQSPASRSEP